MGTERERVTRGIAEQQGARRRAVRDAPNFQHRDRMGPFGVSCGA